MARKLGLRSAGSASKTFPPHAKRLGVALPRSRQGGPRRWTDAQLIHAVKGGGDWAPATTWKQIFRRMGLAQNGQERIVLRKHMGRLNLPPPTERTMVRR
jgi:hypothetical protein